MALRWNVIIMALGTKYAIVNACISIIKGALLGVVTPGKLGELLRARYLTTETGVSPGKAVFSVVIDRIYDLVILFVLSGISLIILSTTYAIDISLPYVVALSIGFILCFTLFINERFARFILSPVFNLLVPERHQESARLHFNEFYDGLRSMEKSTHVACSALSVVIWLLKLLTLFLLSLALGIELSFWFVIAIGSISVLVSLIPISVSGLGTREAIFIFFLSLHNISAEFAVALSFLFLIFPVLGTLMLGGFIYMYETRRAWSYHD